MVGKIPKNGLYQKSHECRDTDNQTHLGQIQSEFVCKHRQQRPDKRLKKIPGKVHQKQSKNYFFVDFGRFDHDLAVTI